MNFINYLLSEGIIDSDQASNIQFIHNRDHKKYGEILIEKRILDQREIMNTLKQYTQEI